MVLGFRNIDLHLSVVPDQSMKQPWLRTAPTLQSTLPINSEEHESIYIYNVDDVVEICVTGAYYVNKVLHMRLKTDPSMEEKWVVFTDQFGKPVQYLYCDVLHVLKEGMAEMVFKRDDTSGTEMINALDEAMKLHNETLSEFASQITPRMTSHGMTSDMIISLMGENALQKRLKA